MHQQEGASTNKFGVYDWSSPSTVAYVKAKFRTTSSGNGNLNFSLGTNTIASDNNSYTGQYNNSVTSFTITYASGSISTVVRRISGSNTAIASHGFEKDTNHEIEVYANNGGSAVSYSRSGTNYSLASQTWDLWVDGTRVVSGAAKAGTLASGTNINGFAFFAESSTSNAAWIYLDDLEYSNAFTISPSVAISPASLSGFTYVEGLGPSAEQSFTVSGANLTHNISITAPTNYEISTATGASFSATSPITLTQSGGNVSTTTIYVRLKEGLSMGSYNSENIAISTTGATTQNMVCSGTVTICGGSENFSSSSLTASYADGSFVGNNGITWTYVQSRNEDVYGIDGKGIMLRRASDNSKVYSSTVATGIGSFSVKLRKGFTGTGNRQVELFVNGVSKGTSQTFGNFSGADATVYDFEVNDINIAGDVVIEIRNITANQVVVDDIAWTCFISPTVIVSQTSLSNFLYESGNGPSATQSFTVSGLNLEGNITLTAPANYEISTSAGSGFGASLSLTPSSKTVVETTIYVRLKSGLTVNTYANEAIILATTNASDQEVVCSGRVIKQAPTTQASEIVFSNASYTSLKVNWTPGNGDGRIVLINTSNSFTTPTNGILPTANSVYQGGGEQVVYIYDGEDNHVTITALDPNTTYWVRVYEYNNETTFVRYNTTSSTDNPLSGNTKEGPCIFQGFDAGTTVPSGWTFTGSLKTYNTTGNFGAASPSIQFDATGQSIETPTATDVVELKFWIKGQNTDELSALLVEGWNGATWVTIHNITDLPRTARIKTYNASTTPALPVGITKFKFTYTKNVGNLSFDDIEIFCTTGPFIAESTDEVTNLIDSNCFAPDVAGTFIVAGKNLTQNIDIVAPTNYEISLEADNNYTSSITLNHTAGVVSETTIYVRLKPWLKYGNYSDENILITSQDARTKEVNLVGAVNNNAGHETFDKINLVSGDNTTYETGSFVGNNGITWNYTGSRRDARYEYDGQAIMFGKKGDDSKIISSPISGGIQKFSVQMWKAYTNAFNRQIQVIIYTKDAGNNFTVERVNEVSPIFGNVIGVDLTVHTFTIDNIDIEADEEFVIGIYHNTQAGAATRAQICIDNITWISPNTDPEIEEIIWTGAIDNDWNNRGNWIWKDNDVETTLCRFAKLSENLVAIIPAPDNSQYYSGEVTNYPILPENLGDNTDVVAGIGVLNAAQVQFTKKIIMEYGASIVGTENLGENRYDEVESELIIEDRDKWMLVGTVVRPYDGTFDEHGNPNTRNVVSGDFFLNFMPHVYMNEIDITSIGEEAGAISWQRPFTSLQTEVQPQTIFAIRVPDQYGNTKPLQFKLPSVIYYRNGTAEQKALGTQPIRYVFRGRFQHQSSLPEYDINGDYAVLNNTYPAGINATGLAEGNGTIILYDYPSQSFRPATEEDIIQPKQGFIFARGNGAINKLEVPKGLIVAANARVKNIAAPKASVHLSVSNINNTLGSSVVVKYNSDKDNIFNPFVDAPKIFNDNNQNVPELYILQYGKKLSALDLPLQKATIPLAIRSNVEKTIRFNASKLIQYETVILEDRLSGLSYDLHQQSEIELVVFSGNNEGRFYLVLGDIEGAHDGTGGITTGIDCEKPFESMIDIFTEGNNLIVSTPQELTQKRIIITDMAGRVIEYTPQPHYTVISLSLAKGTYLVKVITDNVSKDGKIVIR